MIDTWSGNRTLHRRAGHHGLPGRPRGGPGGGEDPGRRRATELVTLIDTTRTLVGFTDEETVPVSYSGGMFSDDGFRELFLDALGASPPTTTCDARCSTPHSGAALYAAKHRGHPLSERRAAPTSHQRNDLPTR